MKPQCFWLSGALAIAAGPAVADPFPVTPPAELKKLSLEELMNLEVTLVSRSPEKLSESPSAIQVITGEDIRRSGAVTLAEALRLAPNLQVARQNAHDWAITARGFNGAPLANNSLADKLLVMIDGRSVYTPLFGGVFWDVQQVLLEDIDRIEVVSGPGGTLWGANAVNGVINVLTKSARDTQGAYVTGGGGSLWQDFGAVRYGGAAGSNVFYRVYGQRFDHYDTEVAGGGDGNDAWKMTRGGFRLDWHPSAANTFTFQGDAYSGREDKLVDETTVDGQNVLGRWTRQISERSDFTVQMYLDRTWRNLNEPTHFNEELITYDVDVQHRFPLGERQTLLWGGNYRFMHDDVHNSPGNLVLTPEDRDLHLFSGFVQDEIALVPDRLRFTLGTKLEHNEFSGLEVQPGVRLAWTPTERHTAWAAVSRAVRSPARLDTDLTFPAGGDRDFAAEKVMAYEIGYRVRPGDRLSLSFAGFFNRYDDLRSVNLRPTPPTFRFENDQRAETWGGEVGAEFRVSDWWRVRGGYTYLQERLWSSSGDVVPSSDEFEALDPQHQLLVQSLLDLPANFELDLVGRFVSALPASPLTASPPISEYFTFDARLAWSFRNCEFAVVGQNLWADEHSEFGAPGTRHKIPRSVHGRITLRF